MSKEVKQQPGQQQNPTPTKKDGFGVQDGGKKGNVPSMPNHPQMPSSPPKKGA